MHVQSQASLKIPNRSEANQQICAHKMASVAAVMMVTMKLAASSSESPIDDHIYDNTMKQANTYTWHL